MLSPLELEKELSRDELFKSWKKSHPNSFLSHLFCQITTEFIPVSSWEIGFYESDKITIFMPLQNGEFAIKPADDVFKQPNAAVDRLDIKTVKIDFSKVKEIFAKNQPECFPKEVFGNGFIILQALEGKTVWNVTFITKSLKFANMKLNAEEGDLASHTLINFVEKPLVK